MWGSGSQSPWDAGSQSQGLYDLSQEPADWSQNHGQSQSQSLPVDLSQTQYGLSMSQMSQQSQGLQPTTPTCTECLSTEMTTTDDGDMVRRLRMVRRLACVASSF